MYFLYFIISRSMGMMFARMFRCVMTTPFGSAVAPDVKMISAVSSAFASVFGATGSAFALASGSRFGGRPGRSERSSRRRSARRARGNRATRDSRSARRRRRRADIPRTRRSTRAGSRSRRRSCRRRARRRRGARRRIRARRARSRRTSSCGCEIHRRARGTFRARATDRRKSQ